MEATPFPEFPDQLPFPLGKGPFYCRRQIRRCAFRRRTFRRRTFRRYVL